MNSIDIYTKNTNLNSFIESAFTVEQLQEFYDNATVFGNKAKVVQCCICAKIQESLHKQYNGKVNSKGYKQGATQILLALNMKKAQFNKDAAVGRYVIEQNDASLFDKPKSFIESKFLPPKEPKKTKQKEASHAKDATNNEEFYKDIIRQFRDWSDTNTRIRFKGICDDLGINPSALGL